MPKIAIAEDDPATRALVTQLLTLEGYQVEAFADGALAQAGIRASKPDLVVLDLMMPNVDGITLLRSLRSDPATQTLPVVILTARSDDTTTWAGWSGGCDYYMTKPFEPEDLVGAIGRLLPPVGAIA